MDIVTKQVHVGAKHLYPEWRFLQLLLLIFAWMLVSPRLEDRLGQHVLMQIMLLDVLLVTLWANQGWHRVRTVVIALWALSLLATVLAFVPLPPEWHTVARTTEFGLLAPVLAACAAGVLSFVFRSRRLTVDGIFATVVAYMLISFVFGELYQVALAWDHDAFHLPVPLSELSPRGVRSNMLYFSLVTLTTVGYGDILPNNDTTKMLAVIEAVVGQFYVAVVVAVFVGMYAARARDSEKT